MFCTTRPTSGAAGRVALRQSEGSDLSVLTLVEQWPLRCGATRGRGIGEAPRCGFWLAGSMGDQGLADEYGETWAPVYDDVHGHMEPGPAVAVLEELASGRSTLELGIGTGRVALPLRERGVLVRGVDASPAMVEGLRSKPGGDAIEVVMGDMASVPLGGPHGLVFVVFNTFFGLGDQDRQVECFANVASSLEPGGLFVLECFVPDLLRFRDGNQTVRVESLVGSQLRLNASVHDAARQTVRTQVLVVNEGAVWARPISLRYCWPSEMDLMARLAGLELADRWSGWERAPFTKDSTQHVSVYRRPLTTS
jgi:SAM-dependent methyltransferase